MFVLPAIKLGPLVEKPSYFSERTKRKQRAAHREEKEDTMKLLLFIIILFR